MARVSPAWRAAVSGLTTASSPNGTRRLVLMTANHKTPKIAVIVLEFP